MPNTTPSGYLIRQMKILSIVYLVVFSIVLSSITSDCFANPKQTPSEQLRAVDRLLEKADEARAKKDHDKALRLYGATIAACGKFSSIFPNKMVSLIKFRTGYCQNQMMFLLSKQQNISVNVNSSADLTHKILKTTIPPSDKERRRAANIKSIRQKQLTGAMDLCRAGKYEAVELLARELLHKNKQDGLAHLLLGTASLGQGHIVYAEKELEISTHLMPDSPEAHYNYAQILTRKTPPDIAKARLYYKKAVELGAKRDEEMEVMMEIMKNSSD